MVTKTSIEAYKKVPSAMVLEYAELLHQRTKEGKTTTDREAAEMLHWETGTVSARRNDLLKEGVYHYKDGYKWRPILVGEKYCRQTRCTVQTWALVIFNDELTGPLFTNF